MCSLAVPDPITSVGSLVDILERQPSGILPLVEGLKSTMGRGAVEANGGLNRTSLLPKQGFFYLLCNSFGGHHFETHVRGSFYLTIL